MGLHPSPTTQKALLSTTSHFVGEWERDGILVSLAWPDFNDPAGFVRWGEGLASRTAVVLAFETEPIAEAAGRPLPDYSPTADAICSYLSLLFGKRFDNHGVFEGSGYFHVPDLTHYSTLSNPHLPQNSHKPRADFPVPLDLAETARIGTLLLNPAVESRFSAIFRTACKFYLQALQSVERDAEVAYLHLITAGEVLSWFHKYDDDVLVAKETQNVLNRMRQASLNGDRDAKLLRGQLRCVKRQFVETIMQFVDQPFFDRSEAGEFGGFHEADFRKSIEAAYDLRSRYVHTGESFGQWVAPRTGDSNMEVQLGKPVLEDTVLVKILERAPTYVGLERVVRCCLLCFAQLHNAYSETY